MTCKVNALLDQGFATRTVHPDDRRWMHVGVTRAGKALLTEAREQPTTRLAQRVAGLSADEASSSATPPPARSNCA
ncbi:hypothetical protein [Arthrobacter sp. 135MFCol5.1]|uniref:hypothetical protein n=1 Tax=Arthrobacter sp. 135MFCol5.1 TaxID=1158050 RepID=UPI0012DC5DB2|nr:hypothetical protein [Arthrobacter sp. 135MFCol5.1]